MRGGMVVTHDGELAADIGIAHGKIVSLDLKLAASAREDVNAGGLHIFPGLIDSHVHFNDPGRGRLGGDRIRFAGAGGGRGHDVFRHAAEFVPANARRDEF